jgi:hypothetical protein
MSNAPNASVNHSAVGQKSQHRAEFLMRMYTEMWGNINRHVLVVWQAVGVLGATLAAFGLAERKIIAIDWAISILILAAAWLVAHAIDANLWYNRNLAIIINIERQFLKASDTKLIHPYFKTHRDPSIVGHLRIQIALGIGVALLSLLYHFLDRILPVSCWRTLLREPIRAMPYLIFFVAVLILWWLHRRNERQYRKFLNDSPGKQIDEAS